MSALSGYGHVLLEAPHGLEASFAAKGSRVSGKKLAGTIRDVILIALAWAIFIGVMMHPGVQIIGILACAVALLVGGGRAVARRTA
jgi:hypothetical protein